MNRLWFAICFFSLVCPAVHGTLDISFRLSTYQTGASNAIMYVMFKTDVDIPATGSLEIQSYGTTSNPPGGGTSTAATILCVGDTESWGLGSGVPGYQTAPNCGTWNFWDDDNSKNPYRIRMPSGLTAGSYYGFALGISAPSCP